MTNHELSLPPEISAILDGYLDEWSVAQQLSTNELETLRAEILSSTELPSDWWERHMTFFNKLMKQVDTAQEMVTQVLGNVALSNITVNVQGADSPIAAFSGGPNWQPYLKLA